RSWTRLPTGWDSTTKRRKRGAKRYSKSSASCSSSARCTSAATDHRRLATAAGERKLTRGNHRPGGHDERRIEAEEARQEGATEVPEGKASGQARRRQEGSRLDLVKT